MGGERERERDPRSVPFKVLLDGSPLTSSRNRNMHRRGGRGDRLDRPEGYANDSGDRMTFGSGSGGSSSGNTGGMGGGYDSSYGSRNGENGFSGGEAARYLSERWIAALNSSHNTGILPSDRPVQLSSVDGSSGWGSSRLIHQASVTDFLQEMAVALKKHNAAKKSCVSLATSPVS